MLAALLLLAAPDVGDALDDFKLKDAHRRIRSLASWKEAKAFVVVFLDTECPLANLYLPTLAKLQRKGVQFVAISSSAHDPFNRVASHAEERAIPFPVLKDFDGKVAGSFGATRSPEAFLLDAKRVIRYKGRIDDQYAPGVRKPKPTRSDLGEAIDELLAGKKVSIPATEPVGCLIERMKLPEAKVDHARHVAPILQRRCQECHRPGQAGPFPLLAYEDAKKRSARIREAVLEERMPPWHADPAHGAFQNDRRLTGEERETLLTWIAQGCPKGDEKDLLPAKKWPEGWSIGKPDKVFSMAEEFSVPATGVMPYKRFTVDPGFKEDVWVEAAEARPGDRRVVHHVIVYFKAPGKELYERDGRTTTLVGWAPGDMPARYGAGMAKRIPAGSKLVFEVHYTPDGTVRKDRCSVGLVFAKRKPEREVETNILANLALRLKAGDGDIREKLSYTFPADAEILSFMPHLHLRGTSARYELMRPDGKAETLLAVPAYDFAWQSVYRFKAPVKAPKGSVLTWAARWDNSADNPRNPDATKEVRWGLQTWDEMQNGWMELVWDR
ncbi:MAG: thioredoxin family protein [Gemmataceae bacterium]|nr:thioredoxin family protein [Gemmataceae bacterium]